LDHASFYRTEDAHEALTLSLPPTPGQSIVKRPRNARLFSLGQIFRSKGYSDSISCAKHPAPDAPSSASGGYGWENR
jgi:hypothetical protein